MADDTNPRYHSSNDPYARGSNADASGAALSDPLAELARLIGQNDPFSEFNRGRSPQRDAPQHAHEPAAEWSPPASGRGDYAAPQAVEPQLSPDLRQPEYPQFEHGQYSPDPTRGLQPPMSEHSYEVQQYDDRAGRGYHNGGEPYPASYDRRDQRADHERLFHPHDERRAAPARDEHQAAPVYERPSPATDDERHFPSALERSLQPPYERPTPPAHERSLQTPYERPAQPAHDKRPLTPTLARSALAAHDLPDEAFDRPPDGRGFQPEPYTAREGQPQGDDIYDETPSGRRRGGMIAVAAVLCLAVVGTAGAFGYRAVFGSSGPGSAPPVIRADVAPSKVVPPPVATGEASTGKLSYERVGAPGQPEKVVPREEVPVEVPATRSVPPRVAAPSAPGGSQPVAVPPAAAQVAPAPPAAAPAGAEPRRIRTVTIRPDQPGAVETPARAAAGAAPFRTASAPPPAATPETAPTRSARPAQAAAPPQPGGTGPLQLTPEGTALPPPSAVAPAQRAAPPVRAAARAVPAGEGGGGYLVQVSSQRSEADARSSFRTLQSKFPNQLGERQPIIRRADLGDKGVFYRAQIGPFGSVDEAGKLCSELKAAGGQCVVQKN